MATTRCSAAIGAHLLIGGDGKDRSQAVSPATFWWRQYAVRFPTERFERSFLALDRGNWYSTDYRYWGWAPYHRINRGQPALTATDVLDDAAKDTLNGDGASTCSSRRRPVWPTRLSIRGRPIRRTGRTASAPRDGKRLVGRDERGNFHLVSSARFAKMPLIAGVSSGWR